MIPPYVPPTIVASHPRSSDSVSKTASLMSHMHINSSPSQLSQKSSTMSLSDKASSTSTNNTDEKEKKKKKGLKRFF